MSEIVGHDAQIHALTEAVASGRLHHGWILAGPKGIGKATLARAFARRLLADAAGPLSTSPGLEVDTAHPIARLMDAGSHPDFIEITRLSKDKDEGNLARNINVDQIRATRKALTMRPSMADQRVVLIDAADDMERPAANALLKYLEEPPSNTLFLLISHAPGRLLPTIRSRCRVLTFKPLDDPQTLAVVRRNLPEATEAELRSIIAGADGSPGRALSFAGLDVAGLDDALGAIAHSGDPDNSKRVALAKSLSGKAAKARYDAFLERVPAFLAARARQSQGPEMKAALDQWDAARQLAGGALLLNLDPMTTVVSLCGMVAAVGEGRQAP
ncbi:MAG: DNA polymerase III subunit delta' [Sphingobium sp.]|nr:DNA polymerase III subunit delta' [Sphingobium sp.]